MAVYVYILECADGSYYTGSTLDVYKRLAQHNQEIDENAYTYGHTPVVLKWFHLFQNHREAARTERQIKGWRRAKKEALINGEFHLLPELARTAKSRYPANQ